MALHPETLKELPHVTGCYDAFLTIRALSLSSYDSQKESYLGQCYRHLRLHFKIKTPLCGIVLSESLLHAFFILKKMERSNEWKYHK